jgi:hypothetical protein
MRPGEGMGSCTLLDPCNTAAASTSTPIPGSAKRNNIPMRADAPFDCRSKLEHAGAVGVGIGKVIWFVDLLVQQKQRRVRTRTRFTWRRFGGDREVTLRALGPIEVSRASFGINLDFGLHPPNPTRP